MMLRASAFGKYLGQKNHTTVKAKIHFSIDNYSMSFFFVDGRWKRGLSHYVNEGRKKLLATCQLRVKEGKNAPLSWGMYSEDFFERDKRKEVAKKLAAKRRTYLGVLCLIPKICKAFCHCRHV